MLETRELKVIFGKAGNGYPTYRLTLPTSWIDELKITEDERILRATLDGNKIILEKSNL